MYRTQCLPPSLNHPSCVRPVALVHNAALRNFLWSCRSASLSISTVISPLLPAPHRFVPLPSSPVPREYAATSHQHYKYPIYFRPSLPLPLPFKFLSPTKSYASHRRSTHSSTHTQPPLKCSTDKQSKSSTLFMPIKFQRNIFLYYYSTKNPIGHASARTYASDHPYSKLRLCSALLYNHSSGLGEQVLSFCSFKMERGGTEKEGKRETDTD